MSHSLTVSLSAAALLIAVLLLFTAPATRAVGSGPKPAPANQFASSDVNASGRSKAWRSMVLQDPCQRFTAINFAQDVNRKLETTDCRFPDGSFADLYAFSAVAGQQIAITLNSTAFDAYLFLADSNLNLVGEDDDGGGVTNARIPMGSGFFSLPATGNYIIAANSFGPNETGDYALRLNVSGRVVSNASAASFSGAVLASNSIVAAFGAGLATQTAQATTQPLPTSLAGTMVEVTDSAGQKRLAPLFFVAPSQVNYLMPEGTAAGVAAVRITSGDGQTAQGASPIAAVAPGLFAANANGQGVAAAIALRVSGDGTRSFEPVAQFDSATNRFVSLPIDLGPDTDQVFLLLFATGVRGRTALSAVRVTFGGVDAEVLFAGAQADFAGLDQINARLQRSLIGRGEVDVTLTVDGRAANLVRVRIR